MTNKLLGMLGLCRRAGKVRSGEFSTEKSIKDGKSKLVLIATDASDNTKKKFHDMSTYRHVPCYEYSTKDELGHTLGQGERSSLSVEERGFATQMIKILDGGSVNVR